MKCFTLKTSGILPILALSMTPTSFATAETMQIAQMPQTYCTTGSEYGSSEVTLYGSPNGEVIVGIDEGETVAFSSSDRSEDWYEVSTSDGVIGWVESQYLSCDFGSDDSAYSDDSASYEEPSDDSYYSDDSGYSEEY
jgi:Bacterial SH3 domain